MSRFDLQKIFKHVRYPLLFVVSFFVFLIIQFPVDRFAPMVERQMASALGREVHIGDLSMSITGSIILEDVRVAIPMPEGNAVDTPAETESSEEGDADEKTPPKPRNLFYTIDEISLDIGYIALLFGELQAGLELELFGGEIELSYAGPLPTSGPKKRAPAPRRPLKRGDEEEVAPDSTSDVPINISVTVENLVLAQILELKNKLPLPLKGELSLSTALSSESGKFADLDGEIQLELNQLIAGTAGGQIEVGGMPMTIDPIAVESLTMQIEVKKGVGEVSKFITKSRDFDLKLEGELNLADPLERSRFDLYVMFKILDGYTQKSDTAKLLVTNLEEFSREIKRAKRDDGYYGFKYRGMMRNIETARFTPSKTSGKERKGRASKRRSRKDRKSKTRTTRDRARRQPPTGTPGIDPSRLTPPPGAPAPAAGTVPSAARQPARGVIPGGEATTPPPSPPVRPGAEIPEPVEEETEEGQEVVESESEEASPEIEGEEEGEEAPEAGPEEEVAEEDE